MLEMPLPKATTHIIRSFVHKNCYSRNQIVVHV